MTIDGAILEQASGISAAFDAVKFPHHFGRFSAMSATDKRIGTRGLCVPHYYNIFLTGSGYYSKG